VSIKRVCSLANYLTIGGGLLCSGLVLLLSTSTRVHELPPTTPLGNKHEVSRPKKGINRCTQLEYGQKEEKVNLTKHKLRRYSIGSQFSGAIAQVWGTGSRTGPGNPSNKP
jgi:hypothetical protein